VTRKKGGAAIGFAFKLLVILPVLVGLAWAVSAHPGAIFRPQLTGGERDSSVALALWIAVVATVELLPVSVSSILRLSLSFPILLGVAILYRSPLVIGFVTLLGAFDSREIQREIAPVNALFNRCQAAAAFMTGSALFHEMAALKSPLYLLVAGILLATAATYVVNVTLVVAYMRVVYRNRFREVLKQLRVGALSEFLLSYLGLGFVGLIIAKLYEAVGLLSVAAFILPLVFARQMFFRNMALEEAHKELKDRERVLRALSNRMAEERQDERMQIAAYLHDDLAQTLFRLGLQVEMAKKRLGQGQLQSVGSDLDKITAAKQETSDAVRALIRDLHRSPIGRKGLGEAIQNFAEDISRGHPTKITTEVVEVPLPPPIQLLIYQIVREAAMNSLKHAEAESILITLRETDDGVELQIRDDGKGFDTQAPPPEGHFGSVMMRERALVAGGTYSIQSQPGEGTAISATFPRVWVEEATLVESRQSESNGANKPAHTQRPPVGSTVGPPRLVPESPRAGRSDSNGQAPKGEASESDAATAEATAEDAAPEEVPEGLETPATQGRRAVPA
jgi:signal transduction histidine kinase